MKCRKFEEQIYLFEELTLSERESLVEHAMTCFACNQLKKEVFENQMTIRSSFNTAKEQNPDQLTQRIMQLIRAKQRESWWANFMLYLDRNHIRYALPALSLFLISFFIYEAQVVKSIRSQAVAYPAHEGAKLETKIFLEAYKKGRENDRHLSRHSKYAYYRSQGQK